MEFDLFQLATSIFYGAAFIVWILGGLVFFFASLADAFYTGRYVGIFTVVITCTFWPILILAINISPILKTIRRKAKALFRSQPKGKNE
ncbi:hypothetical protein [Pseudomonas putida]|uniref:Uncharacterized protein n=1 Tax=Pseudomonas putida TaxID=303 RepID=A0A8I1EII4_PSEPU|nr:hypothetical protein [Pseudomonas putida]MBI6885842.1 hypothetical protein [Pseudomonas putida]